MVKFPVKYFVKVVTNAFHGTTLEVAKKIHKEQRFIPSYSEQNYLGDGVYFYEASMEYAKTWAREKFNGDRIGVIRSVISLGRCLDLHDREHIDFLRKTASDLAERSGKQITDAFVINFIAGNFSNKVDTVRATYTKRYSKRVFKGSHFYYENALIICVRNLQSIVGISLLYKGV